MSGVPESRDPNADVLSQNEPEQSGQANETTIDIPKSDVFYILRNQKRRVVLSQLLMGDGRKSLSDIIDRVALEEYGKNPRELTSDERKRIYTGLYQSHLPRMEEFGLVDFDKDSNTVVVGEKAPAFEPYLDEESQTSARIELAVALIVTPLVIFGVFGVGPLAAVPLVLWAGLTVCALFGLSLFGLYKRSR